MKQGTNNEVSGEGPGGRGEGVMPKKVASILGEKLAPSNQKFWIRHCSQAAINCTYSWHV